MRHQLLLFDWKTCKDFQGVLDRVVGYFVFGAGALDETRLVVEFVVYFRARDDDVAKHVKLEARIVVLLDVSYVLHFANHAHHAKVKEL